MNLVPPKLLKFKGGRKFLQEALEKKETNCARIKPKCLTRNDAAGFPEEEELDKFQERSSLHRLKLQEKRWRRLRFPSERGENQEEGILESVMQRTITDREDGFLLI